MKPGSDVVQGPQKRLRHCATVERLVFKTLAMALLGKPSAANRQMRARRTVRWGLVLAETQAFKVLRSPSDIDNFSAGFHMNPFIAQNWIIVRILLKH